MFKMCHLPSGAGAAAGSCHSLNALPQLSSGCSVETYGARDDVTPVQCVAPPAVQVPAAPALAAVPLVGQALAAPAAVSPAGQATTDAAPVQLFPAIPRKRLYSTMLEVS